ncbi:hypothetical protein JW960_21750 [candidate division KSB1 bacterium]|nr:hypothetical protein [candidate division KSB1 bacterium]
MKKRIRENIFVLFLVILLGIFFFYNVNYFDRYVLTDKNNSSATDIP